jgi:hypothetical protein
MRAILVALLLLPAGAAPLAGQATLTGRTVDDSTRMPIPDVEIVMAGTDRSTKSDANGRFTLASIEPGVGSVMFRRIGFRPVRLRTVVFGVDTLDVQIRLQRTVLELEPIEVSAAAVPPGMQAFTDRRLAGDGAFIDWSVLRESEGRRLSDLLRSVRGVRITMNRNGQAVALSARQRCPMAIWMDGLPLFRPGVGPPPSVDEFAVMELEAVEAYRGATDTPPELGGTGAQCGTLVLWSRRR